MSCMENKVVIRGKLGKIERPELLKILKYTLGEPEDYCDNSDWYYGEYQYKFHPICSYTGNRVDGYEWFIDYIVSHNSEDRTYKEQEGALTVTFINNIALEMSDLFAIDLKDIQVVAYEWYNGADEPCYFY